MSRFTTRALATLSVAAAAATIAPLATADVSSAASGHGIERALEAICRIQGGTVVHNPFQLARCQEVPPSRRREPLLRTAQWLCVSPLGGSFGSAPSHGTDDGSITWACS